jgi:predicted benzoate:H+ symporter BenE
MVTIRLNVVAFIVTALIAFMFLVWLTDQFTYAEMAQIAVPTFIVIRVYEYIAGLPAFRGKGKKEAK